MPLSSADPLKAEKGTTADMLPSENIRFASNYAFSCVKDTPKAQSCLEGERLFYLRFFWGGYIEN